MIEKEEPEVQELCEHNEIKELCAFCKYIKPTRIENLLKNKEYKQKDVEYESN